MSGAFLVSCTEHILVVDDDLLVRMVAGEALSRAGYTVTLAEDGRDAMRKLESLSVDLIVTDVLMPDKDGLELTQDVKRRWPLMPIIAISSGGRLDSSHYLPLANAMGAEAVMAKPLRPGPFLALVREVLDRSRRRIA